ncbi:hypothetical protein Q6A38_16880, partial [Xanthomonas euvesicatoria pv. eucalypti]|uniref:hypothetical protein n=1 Tax=Xanthomonas euvesicatoria TaxID=456327 RepID=UPI0026E2DE44
MARQDAAWGAGGGGGRAGAGPPPPRGGRAGPPPGGGGGGGGPAPLAQLSLSTTVLKAEEVAPPSATASPGMLLNYDLYA